MRILFLSDNFPPEGNAPAARVYEHAVRWMRDGHDVTVITGAPNFPEGRLFPGYRNAWRATELLDGIRVIRVKTYITANEGFIKRTLDYVSFMVSAFVAGLFEKRPDIIVATSPQFFCTIAGWALAAFRHLPFVFELRDLWPASIVAVGAMRRSLVIRVLEKIELFLYRRAEAVVAVTNSFRNDLIARGIQGDKIHVVLNGVDLDRYSPMPRDAELAQRFDVEGRFVVGYLGTHGMAHGLDKVLAAVEMLKDRSDIVFLFAGGGAERATVERIVAEKALGNVRLAPRQPKEMMPRLWSLCDLSLIPLRDAPVFSTVIPSKLFECMGMGIPVLMSVPEGEATGIVRDAGCGVVVQPEDPALLAASVRSLTDNPLLMRGLREASLRAAPRFSRDAGARSMLKVFAQYGQHIPDGRTSADAY